MSEIFQPKQVRRNQPWLFRFRCIIDLQLSTIFKHLRVQVPRLGGDLLDVGAGDSPWRSLLRTDVKYFGLDVSNSNDFKMSSAGDDITYYDGEMFPFPGEKFMSVLCIEVLEHVKDPTKMLGEIYRVLIRGGTLLLSVPWSARRHHIPFDFYRFTPEGLRQLLIVAGFESIEIVPRGSEAHVIANKLLLFVIGTLKFKQSFGYILRLLLLFFVMPMLAFWYLMSWIYDLFGAVSENDPLGYFVKASKL